MNRQRSFYLLVASCAVCGCASVNSKPYMSSADIDGILYKLPATEIIATSTWRVDDCTPVKLEIEDIEVSYRAVPDEDSNYWFVIDPADLAGLFSSVDPARFEFNKGMISKVSFKATSEVGPLLKESIGLAVKLAAKAGAAAAAPRLKPSFNCTDTAQNDFKNAKDLKTEAEKSLKEAERARDDLQKRFYTKPSAALKLALDRADANVAAANKRLDNLSASWPWIKVTAIARPDRTRIPSSRCPYSDENKNHCFKFEADVLPYKSRFDNLGALEASVAIFGRIDTFGPNGSSFISPPPGSYSGLYYRQPAEVSVGIFDEDQRITRSVQSMPMLHYGNLARVEMSNGFFTNSGYEITFDPAGGLTLYSMTSSSIAKDAVAAMSGAADEADAARLQAMKTQADLIEAKQKLNKLD
jgi:hypothetical protein